MKDVLTDILVGLAIIGVCAIAAALLIIPIALFTSGHYVSAGVSAIPVLLCTAWFFGVSSRTS